MRAERVQDLADEMRERSGVVGAQVGLLLGGERLVACSGTVSYDGAGPVVRDTAFHAGSLAKALTASVVLAAAREGVLELDVSCARQAPGLWSDTPRELMTQITGRPNLLPEPEEGIDDFVARVGAMPRIHPPGRFSYCNAGWSVLDLLLRRLTGRSFEEHAGAQLGSPPSFGMPATAAAGHAVAPGGAVRPVPPVYAEAASAAGSRWWATSDQLLDFAADHLGLTPGRSHHDDLGAMQTAQVRVPGATVADSWGLGWALWQRAGHAAFGWAGYTGGHRAYLRCFPERQAALVVLANTAGPLFGPPGGSAMFDLLLPRLLAEIDVPPLPAPHLGQGHPAAGLAGRFGPFNLEPSGDDGLFLDAQALGEPEPVQLARSWADTFERSGRPPGGMPVAVDGDLLYLGPFAVPRS